MLLRTGVATARAAQRAIRAGASSAIPARAAGAGRVARAFSAAVGSDNIVRSPFPSVPPGPYLPLERFVTDRWDEYGDDVLVINGTTDEARTYSGARSDIDNIAAHLSDMGVAKGDRVAILSPNHVDYISAGLAIAKLGATMSCANPLYQTDEFSRQVENSGSSIIITHPACLETGLEVARRYSDQVKHVLVFGDSAPEGAVDLDSLRKNASSHVLPDIAIDPDDLVALPYSSGTTGLPKGTMLTHHNLCVNLWQTWPGEGRFGPRGSRLISPLPMFHIYGFTISMLNSAWQGQTLITMSGFDLERFCQLVQEHKPQRAHLVPPIVLGLRAHPVVSSYDLSSLEMVICAAAPLAPEVEADCQEVLGFRIKQAWGMSELSPLGTLISDDRAKPGKGSIGELAPDTEGKIVDLETGEALGVGEEGELCIRGPQVMKGYLNAPDKTAECLTADGWLHTGDIAYYDEDGYFYITDRLKELIKYKGYQVAPAELEGVIISHPSVVDACVIPVESPEAGELPRAHVVLAPEAVGAVSEDDIMSHVESKVAPYKKLRGGVHFTDAIPRNPSGKILRREVRANDASLD